MTDIAHIIDFHLNAERQGPGSAEDTLRALEYTGLAGRKELRIADIGCGTGGQTLSLARHLDGHITAVDLFPEFLAELNDKAAHAGLRDRITTLACSMDDLPFESGAFDLIWSEGAIYNIGFEKGVKLWRDYLRVGGYLAVSEITWITPERPAELEEFWQAEYPEVDRASRKIRILEENGFTLAGYFYLAPESWTDSYYHPMKARIPDYLERHGHSEAARAVVAEYEQEMAFYQRFKACYSYGFYIARKDG